MRPSGSPHGIAASAWSAGSPRTSSARQSRAAASTCSALASSTEREGTVAYVETDNILLASDDGRRTWGLRQGTRYTVFVPREMLEGVFVLPAEAVAEMGPDLVVFHREPSGVLIPLPLSVVHRDEQVVIVEPVPGLDLFEGDEIALSGAFALSLAMRGGDATADHGHAH